MAAARSPVDDRGAARVVAVACSGGRDSLALLHATLAAAQPLGVRVVALHVHHGLMPAAQDWQALVADFCARAGLDLATARLQSSPVRGESVEAWARRERYAALARLARAAGASLVLLGHHRRDQAETVLLQALRGAGPAGLAAMPRLVERDGLAWARPWLAVDDDALEAYARAAGLAVVHDPSNVDPRFARSRLRRDVMPGLRAAFPHAEAALAATARRAHEARQVLDEVAADDLRRLEAGDTLPLASWRALSTARRSNALRAWLAERVEGGVPETLLQRLLAETGDDVGRRWPLAEGRDLRSWRGRLAVVAVARAQAGAPKGGVDPGVRPETALRLLRCGDHRVDGWAGTLEVFATTERGVAPHRLAPVLARARAGGEQFQAVAGGVARSLKKQYQSAGIAPEHRGGPLLFDVHGALLFVPGLGVDARAWAGQGAPQWSLRWRAFGEGDRPDEAGPQASLAGKLV